MIATLSSVLSILLNLIDTIANESDVYVGPLNKFAEAHPNTISMHFFCPESNMFATNCACHLKCTSGEFCQNAVQVCKKYRISHGCKYVLTRNNNRIATLKREATPSEKKAFDVSEYKLLNLSSPTIRPTMNFQDMISSSSELSSTYNNIIKQIKVGGVP